MSAKLLMETKMSKKTFAVRPTSPSPSDKTLSRQSNAIAARLLNFLSNTPAITAATVLSDMMHDTSDPATRLAILTTRIQVLRARTIACRLGKPVDGKISLGELIDDQKSRKLPEEIENPMLRPAAPDQLVEQSVVPVEPEKLMRLKLLQDYRHEGFDIKAGTLFETSAQIANDLTARGISEIVPDDLQPDETATNDASTDAQASANADTEPGPQEEGAPQDMPAPSPEEEPDLPNESKTPEQATT